MDGHNISYAQIGFTLFEFSITLSVFTIIATLGYPNIVSSLTNAEAKRISREFKNSIKVSKVTSYSNRKRVFMCLLDENKTCSKNGQEQIILFMDSNGNNNYDPNSDTLIEINNLSLKYGEVELRAGGRHYVRFASDSGAPRGFMGHFKYCPTKDYNKNKYQISNIKYHSISLGVLNLNPTQPTPQPTAKPIPMLILLLY